MGDRVSASIEVGGVIETIEQAEELIQAFMSDVILDSVTDERIDTLEQGQTVLRTAIEAGKPVSGYDHEVNYGNFDEIDAAVIAIPTLWCSTSFGTGGDFSSGINTYINGEKFSCITVDGSLVVELSELQGIIKGNNPDTVAFELARIVSRVEREAGLNLPPLTASPAVSAWLKIFGEQAA